VVAFRRPAFEKEQTMSRFALIDPASASSPASEMLAAVRRKLGLVPNMTRVMANAPATLNAYLSFTGALAEGTLDKRVGELIALTVAQANGCDYCLAAHTAIGGMLKMPAADLVAARDATNADARTRAILVFARQVTDTRGHVTDADVATLRAAGVTDGEIAEVIAHVALNFFTNLVNSVALTDIDFPVAPALRDAA